MESATPTESSAPEISREEILRRLHDPTLVVLNVLPAEAFSTGHIPGSINLGELRAIHDLLYRPQQVPEEQVLESLLATLAAALRELLELMRCPPELPSRSAILSDNLRSITRLASEICGECVPRAYAPSLKEWMDRIQEMARNIPD